MSGEAVFLGTLLSSAPVEEWTGLTVPDLNGKVAVMLDAAQAAGPGQAVPGPGPLASARTRFLRDRGARGLVTVIRPEREKESVSQRLRVRGAGVPADAFPGCRNGVR